MSPPEALSNTVSTRNCITMSRRRAPSARRMPISRVRSVTLASMMFMIPIPPTNSEMAAMEPSTTLKICLVRSARLSSSSGMMIS